MGRLPHQTAPTMENVSIGLRNTVPVHWQQAINFARTWKTPLSIAAGLGVSAFIIMSDWKVIVNQIPIYNKQFKKTEE